ncbi:Retinol dehydrogenase 12 [Colletotrichum higginsianum]|uniref:Retinol dehydrogenase 12 n=1 Tax=Colletotrichum higginsianum TaxID=80884 RepID=A0A4T0W8E2_9PEZI|nr:Retinol dehydrogenase 12 [Colletotrichum higginsianum]
MSRYAAVHQNPQGMGDARPTALQIVEDEGLVGKLVGKTALVTGANQGIGLETARALYAAGMTVFLGVRSLEKGQRAIEDITASATADAKGALRLVEMSLDSLDSVRSGAKHFLAQSEGRLNILILNAGIMADAKTKTADGFESHLGTNHAGHFLLFQLLKESLLASATPALNSRVVAVASMAHRASEIRFHDLHFDEAGAFEQQPLAAYGQSKTANIYTANEIDRRYGPRGLRALSVHPGAIPTEKARDRVDVEAMKAHMGEEAFARLMDGLKSPVQGAATTVFAALSREWEGKGGRYLADCAEAGPAPAGYSMTSTDPGYAPWAYDAEKAARLWRESCKMVGVEEEEEDA